MSTWFSEYRVRCLAQRIAPRIMPSVAAAISQAINATISAELPALLMDELRNEIPEFVPKHSVALRRDRDAAIRAQYNGRNAKELSTRFGVSVSSVFKIVKVGRL
jgi:Mor family transcriptional regulator